MPQRAVMVEWMWVTNVLPMSRRCHHVLWWLSEWPMCCVAVWRRKAGSCWLSTAALSSTMSSFETTSSWLVRRDWLGAVLLNRFFLTFSCPRSFVYLGTFGLFSTTRCYASTVCAVGLCLSVARRCSTEMAQHRNTLLVQLDSPAIWLSDIKGFREIRPGSASMGAPNAGGVG